MTSGDALPRLGARSPHFTALARTSAMHSMRCSSRTGLGISLAPGRRVSEQPTEASNAETTSATTPGRDVIALMDALGHQRFAMAGPPPRVSDANYTSNSNVTADYWFQADATNPRSAGSHDDLEALMADPLLHFHQFDLKLG